MKKQNYYTILGIPKGATPEEIRLSYRALALRFHPDRNPDDPQANEKFHLILEAYEVLSDPIKRQQYDQLGALFRADGRPPEKEDLSAFISDTFSRIFSRQKERKGTDIHYEITLTLEQVAHGTQVPINILRECICDFCRGIGAAPKGLEICPECSGKGKFGGIIFRNECTRCGGLGNIITKRCKNCGGTGRFDKRESLDIQIPRGIQAGQTLRIRGKGNDGSKKGLDGHLFVRIQFKNHSFFERRGTDIFCDVPILWTEAVLGATIPVPTLTGTSAIRIPKGTQTHQVFRLKGQGLPDTKGENCGDIHYKIIIDVPTLDTHLEKKIGELNKILSVLPNSSVQSFRNALPSIE